jgi:hypothetical protein
MLQRVTVALASLFLLPHGCAGGAQQPVQLQHPATGKTPQVLAVYEPWFGKPNHINVGYSSNDPDVLKKQIDKAKKMGISTFVVDWYGDRDQFIDGNYALLQGLAAQKHFGIAMMYDESEPEVGATDEVIADFTKFHDTYLAASAAGRSAYLTYEGRPVIFIFPNGGKTDWNKVRAVVNKWSPAPLLINENLPGQYAADFDGFYAWPNPGPKGWAPDGSNWGADYLSEFYETLTTKYPDKIIVGGAWAKFDDSKASWSLNRKMDGRCGQTFWDTFGFWHKYIVPDQAIPFMMVDTWNDYEEGTEVEPGLPTCDGTVHKNLQKEQKKADRK